MAVRSAAPSIIMKDVETDAVPSGAPPPSSSVMMMKDEPTHPTRRMGDRGGGAKHRSLHHHRPVVHHQQILSPATQNIEASAHTTMPARRDVGKAMVAGEAHEEHDE